VDGYWERGLAPWDMVAGIILVQEAGGKVTAYNGSDLQIDSGRILATNSYLHQIISEELMQVNR
jgi:myo-inositol-1(or 4)-monophosphatase